MIKLSYENITAWIRIVSYFIAGNLVNYGIGSGGASSKETIAGIILALLTGVWTLFGQRVVAKINEVAKMDVVEVISIAKTTEGKAVAEAAKAASPEAAATVEVAKS